MGEKRLRNLLKSLAVLVAVLFCSTSVCAEKFEVDGIFYNTISADEVEVDAHPDKALGYFYDIIIPETVTHQGKTYSVTAIGYRSFRGCIYLTSVTIPSSVTVIKKEAFENCINVSAVNFASSGLIDIEMSAFSGCKELTSLNLPSSLLHIEDYAFKNCSKVEEIILPDGIESLGYYVFSGIKWLDSPEGPVYLGNVLVRYNGTVPESLTVKNGTKIIASEVFKGKSELKTINFPSSLMRIEFRAFYGCSNLANVKFANESAMKFVEADAFKNTSWFNNKPDGEVYIGTILYKFKGSLPYDDTSYKVKDGTTVISPEAFYNNALVKEVTIPASVTEIGDRAFYSSWHIEKLNLSEGLKVLGNNVFESCSNLSSLKLPNSLEEIGDEAFIDCRNLVQIDIPANVKKFGNSVWSGTRSLESINVSPDNKYFCDVDGVMYSKDKKTLIKFPTIITGDYVIPDYVENLAADAFNNVYLKSITVPSSVRELNNDNFNSCTSLVSVNFEPKSSIKFIENILSGCDSLKSVVLPDSLVEIGWNVLSYDWELEDIKFPETLISVELDDNKWYDNQPDGVVYVGKLALDIKGENPKDLVIKEGTKYINSYFPFNNDTIKSLTLPESLCFIQEKAFYGTLGLKDIKGGCNAKIGRDVFNNTLWMTNESWKQELIGYYGVSAINIFAHESGSALDIEIEPGTKYICIGEYNLIKIADVSIPGTVERILDKGLENLNITRTVTVDNLVPPIFEGCPNLLIESFKNATLVVPEKSLDAYKNAKGWKLFKNIIGNPDLSGVGTVETADNVRVFANGENIVVEGVEEGTPVEVFNLNGQKVYSGVETLISVPARGIYIVRVNGKAYKVAM